MPQFDLICFFQTHNIFRPSGNGPKCSQCCTYYKGVKWSRRPFFFYPLSAFGCTEIRQLWRKWLWITNKYTIPTGPEISQRSPRNHHFWGKKKFFSNRLLSGCRAVTWWNWLQRRIMYHTVNVLQLLWSLAGYRCCLQFAWKIVCTHLPTTYTEEVLKLWKWQKTKTEPARLQSTLQFHLWTANNFQQPFSNQQGNRQTCGFKEVVWLSLR